jgi:wobble nucleotide-excising tRNase
VTGARVLAYFSQNPCIQQENSSNISFICIGLRFFQEALNTTFKDQERIKINDAVIIENMLVEIAAKRRLLNDEEEGAIKVNQYLTNFFGHKFISLEAIEQESDDGDDKKKVKFQIVRDGQKAYHLSEGECSLISFCYFIAKLGDTNTIGKKPIIWIDDPISSLDSNHIFFLYSIIKSEIISRDSFEQIFVSTHNLDFLKYLKRLHRDVIGPDGKKKSYQPLYFLINREDKKSSIKQMPNYLKDFVTEYNYLFRAS